MGAGGIGWVRPPEGHLGDAHALLSTRTGGVSAPPFADLNLGRSAGDALESVTENETRLARAAGLAGPPARARLAHGTGVRIVDMPGIYGPTDGLLTSRERLPLWLTVADCLPVFLAGAEGWIGLLHCGWRGAAAGCVGSIVNEMVEASGRPASTIRAWIGPGIGASCYPVGPEVPGLFPQEAVDHAGGIPHLDLPRVAEIQLREAGLPDDSIARSGLCTSCRPDLFFSFRRDGPRSGRMAAVIWR